MFWPAGIARWRNLALQRNDRYLSGHGLPLTPGDNSAAQRWRAAVHLGLISSTFSTVVSQLSAARIGRDAAVDWMSVAAIPARDWALTADPSIGPIAIGIAFHQWADFSWALVFFGVLGKWTAKLTPASLAIVRRRGRS